MRMGGLLIIRKRLERRKRKNDTRGEHTNKGSSQLSIGVAVCPWVVVYSAIGRDTETWWV